MYMTAERDVEKTAGNGDVKLRVVDKACSPLWTDRAVDEARRAQAKRRQRR